MSNHFRTLCAAFIALVAAFGQLLTARAEAPDAEWATTLSAEDLAIVQRTEDRLAGQPDRNAGRWLGRLLAYEATGDALYDAYQQALLAALAMPVAAGKTVGDAPVIADATLAAWEPQYGSDPRYWQLRMFELQRVGLPEADWDKQSDLLLSQWRQHAGRDPVLGLLLYRIEAYKLEGLPLAERLAGREALLLDFAAQYPEESLPQYELALHYFERGDWEHAMQALEKGNAAQNNNSLEPFPQSFLLQQLREEQSIGNEAVAGIVLKGVLDAGWSFNRGIRINDAGKELQVRAAVGSGSNEMPAFHLFLCRRAQMNGAGTSEAMTSSIVARGLLTQLLTEGAEAFRPDQRGELLDLYNSWDSIFSIERKWHDKQPRQDELLGAALLEAGFTATDLAQYMIDGDPADQLEAELARRNKLVQPGQPPVDPAKVEAMLKGWTFYHLDLCLRAVSLQYWTQDLRHELVDEGRKIQRVLRRNAAFDWVKGELPPLPQD